jgi:hypothetical protein
MSSYGSTVKRGVLVVRGRRQCEEEQKQEGDDREEE